MSGPNASALSVMRIDRLTLGLLLERVHVGGGGRGFPIAIKIMDGVGRIHRATAPVHVEVFRTLGGDRDEIVLTVLVPGVRPQ